MHVLELDFEGDLVTFLHRPLRRERPVRRELRSRASIKDVIESCGVPHTEVDLIVVRGAGGGQATVDFAWVVNGAAHVTIHSAPAPASVLPDAPRLQSRECRRFVADGHLGKLARNLRLLGVDTAWNGDADDTRLLEIMQAEERALLTRDRRLLMHAIVRDGYCPRAIDPEAQTREVLRRFGILDEHAGAHAQGAAADDLHPFRRCLDCNGLLEPVPKSDVLEQLADEPLTLRFFDSFRRCSGCARIYWPGTHFEKLTARVARLTGV